MAEMKTLTINNIQYDITDANAVKFIEQTLTEEQKAQARENIGAASEEGVEQLSEAKVDYADLETEVSNQLDGVKSDIAQQVINAFNGIPVFGTVDENNVITLTNMLADGDYILKYENEDGTLVEIGTIIIGNGESGEDGGYDNPDEPITPIETNQIRLSVDANGNDYVGINGEDGYKVGYRVNSSGVEEKVDGMCVTGFIPYSYETIRLKNVTVTGTKSPYIAIYKADKTFFQVVSITDRLTDDGNGVYTGTAPMNEAGFIRITCGVIDDTSILTLDTEIV